MKCSCSRRDGEILDVDVAVYHRRTLCDQYASVTAFTQRSVSLLALHCHRGPRTRPKTLIGWAVVRFAKISYCLTSYEGPAAVVMLSK